MSRELLQQALEALDSDNPDVQLRAAIALRKALETKHMTKVWTEEHWTDYEQGIIAVEREKVAKWMTAQGYATGHGETIEDLLKELEWQIEDRIRNIIRAKPAKPSRLFSLQAGDNFVLRRNKEKYTLVKLKWTPGMGAQYICQNLKTGETVRLHHSVLVEPDNIQESSK